MLRREARSAAFALLMALSWSRSAKAETATGATVGARPTSRSPRLRYEPSAPPPPGYHFESNPRKGLVVSGALTFGVPYLISVMVAGVSSNEADRWLFVPVTGPIGALARGRRDCNDGISQCAENTLAVVGLAFDLAAQTAGALLFTMAYVFPKKEWVSDYDAGRQSPPTVTWAVQPRVDGAGRVGLVITGTLF
jgi:hypothetical protein